MRPPLRPARAAERSDFQANPRCDWSPKSSVRSSSVKPKQLLVAFALLLAASTAHAEEITLDQAISELEGSSEDWTAVEVRIDRARALRRQALASLLPQLSAGASTTYNGQQVEFGDRVVRRRFDWGASGTARLTLFDATQYPLVAAAKKRIEVAEAQGEWTRRLLRFEVESTFYELAAAQRDIAIAEQTIALRKAYVERAKALEGAGIALPLDVARATAQLLEAEQLLLEAQARMGNQADALAVLLVREPDGTLRANLSPAVPEPPAEAGGTSGRRDLEAQRLEIDALDSVETSRWWLLAPTLGLQGDVRAGPPSFSAPDGVNWSVTLSLGWVLYDGGARYALVDVANANLREAELQLSRAEREARAELTAALRTWRSAYRAIMVAEQQVQVAREAYEMTNARFESGLATSIEVVEASDSLFRAEASLSDARLAADVAAARWRYLRED